MGSRRPAQDLLDRADAARLSGRGEEAARLYDEAIALCRSLDDLPGWTRAALGAASAYVFGAEPGKVPAQLYDVLARTTDPANRARIAAALARCWVYAGHARRATRFADEAVERAAALAAPELLADCLDAALAAHWGPDELEIRMALAARLDEVAAHLLAPAPRLQSHLWGLQVACEALDMPAVHRHLRALERLGEESPRARFFAVSRRLMLELLSGRTGSAPELIARAGEASKQASLADAWMVIEAMKGYTAAQSGDTATCAAVAAASEEFALAEGVAAVAAESAFLWLQAGRPDRARRLVLTFSGPVLPELPRDVNWLLTLQCLLEVALAIGAVEISEPVAELLEPYSGRAVFNAGAVNFHGLVDDTLARAAAVRGDRETAVRLRRRALATYERLGARWWYERLAAWAPPAVALRIRFHPAGDGLWLVGPEPDATTLRELRGFGYLRRLLRQPGLELSAVDLVTGGSGTAIQSELGPVLDREALAAYRRRLQDIDTQIAEADGWSDLGRLENLSAERAAIVDELAGATGLGGRSRTSGGTQERARVAATKAISSAIGRIARLDAPLGAHLHRSVHTGRMCRYEPGSDDRLHWILD